MPTVRAHPAVLALVIWASLSVQLISAGVSSAGAHAEPRLAVSSGFVKAGTNATVTGSGFPTSARVELGFLKASCRCDDSPKTTVKTDTGGGFHWRYAIPASTKPGRYVFWAWSERVGRVIEAPVVVTSPNPIGTARVFVPNCGSTWYLEYQPSSWSAGCTGGSLNVNKLNWREYRSDGARASGQAELRKPCGDAPCYKAGMYRTQGKLSASRPLRCMGGTLAGAVYFSRIEVEVLYRAGNPFGAPAGWKHSIVTIKADRGICHHSP